MVLEVAVGVIVGANLIFIVDEVSTRDSGLVGIFVIGTDVDEPEFGEV